MISKIAIALILSVGFGAFAAETSSVAASSTSPVGSASLPSADPAIESLRLALKNKYPTFPVPSSIARSSIPGVFEMLVGDQISYVDPTGTYFIFNGTMVELAKQRNITEERKGQLLKIDSSALSIADAVVRVKGKGTRKLYLFSDPMCPYCQKLEEEIAKLDDVTIYTFMMPLAIHPGAEVISQTVWCSIDQAGVWNRYMSTREDIPVRTCKNPVERNIELAKSLSVSSTPTMFSADGRRLTGATPVESLEKFLNASAK
jgi:thiol:disulfide interchange protein DsbC